MRCAKMLQATLLITLLCSTGCSSNKGKIEGTKWTSLAATVKGLQVPEGSLGLDFGADKKLVYKIPGQTITGTYSLGMGDNVTLNLDQELAGRKAHVEKVSISGDTLTMTDSDGTSVKFKRVK